MENDYSLKPYQLMEHISFERIHKILWNLLGMIMSVLRKVVYVLGLNLKKFNVHFIGRLRSTDKKILFA